MTKLYVRHTAADFSKWKPFFDGHQATLRKFGAKKAEVFTSIKNPNEIIVITEWDNKDQAKNFLEKSDVKEVMKEAGVLGAPEINFAE
jgi:quinol monooxygenase YgiN